MACKLVYNNEGQFVKALTPDGRESSLFKQILSIPHIRSVKEASELYANIFSKKMYSIMGEKGAQNLDTIDNKLINDKLKTRESIGECFNLKKSCVKFIFVYSLYNLIISIFLFSIKYSIVFFIIKLIIVVTSRIMNPLLVLINGLS